MSSIFDGKLEPETREMCDERAPIYSIAVSLKRIADILSGTSEPSLVVHLGNVLSDLLHTHRQESER